MISNNNLDPYHAKTWKDSSIHVCLIPWKIKWGPPNVSIFFELGGSLVNKPVLLKDSSNTYRDVMG